MLVLNPEEGPGQIEPAELRDALFLAVPDPSSGDAIAAVAVRVAAHVGALPGPLGDIQVLAPPQWYGLKAVGSTRFVGRVPAMWRSTPPSTPGATAADGQAGPGVAQVRGMGGIGKTLLAEEYGLRFGAAYPGGVFWLRVPSGHEGAGRARPSGKPSGIGRCARSPWILGCRRSAWRRPRRRSRRCAAEPRRDAPFLWVVDDVPAGLGAEELRAGGPHSLGKSLLTTRRGEYGALAVAIDPGLLSAEEAYELLTASRSPVDEAEEADARGARGRPRLPRACGRCRGGVVRRGGQNPFAAWRARLAEASGDELELAAQLADALPTGHEPSIAATLLQSIDALGEEGTDLLRLASSLAAAPIPPSLVEGVFAEADGLEESAARDRADLARAQVDDGCLAEPCAGGRRSVRPFTRQPHRPLP